jgi:hypothetical protein
VFPNVRLDDIAVARIKGARTVSFVSWLSAAALLVGSVGVKAAGHWLLGQVLLGGAILAGMLFALCFVYLMCSALVLIVRSTRGGGDGS